jgi:hypothetical protein
MEKEAQTYASRRKIYNPRSSNMDLKKHLWNRSHRLHPLAGGESREKGTRQRKPSSRADIKW